jgi:hypothetical protein
VNETQERRGVSREFSLASFLWRFGASLTLVVATYNPTHLSFYRWVYADMREHTLGPEHFVVGVFLLIGWAILLVATRRSLGAMGLVLVAALLGGVVWWLTDIGLINVGAISTVTWVSLVCLALLLAVGLSWSHIWRRLTGQYEVDDSDG